jgi:16S rRNA (cytosine967-C5)-methyltransferase
VLRRVAEGAFADLAFRAEADRLGLQGRERRLAQRLAYGTIQRRATLDAVVAACASRAPAEIDPPLRDALRLGIYQLLYAGGIPARAAVDQTVELAKELGSGAARFANAVMRRAAREGGAVLEALDETTPEGAAVVHSHPEWLARMWWEVLGADAARALLARDNEPAESALRVNTLRAEPDAVRERLAEAGVPSRRDPALPESLILDAPLDVHGSELFADGLVMPQSRGSMLVARAVDPDPGERVLDLCAAPGAKTTHLAALMGGEGEVVAVERHPGRAEALAANARRLGAAVEVRCADAAERQPDGPFDRVLLDPPCSGLGTLQARPDARWRKSPEGIDALAALQRELLETAAQEVRPGGVLVYSTCTISPRENDEQVAGFLAARPDFDADRVLQLYPHRDGTDGFFVARLRRRA